LEVIPNSGYTNATAIAKACDIIVDNITAAKMWKVKVEENNTDMEIVMDEYVGYLFEDELFGKPGIVYVKYGKRHPHDATGTLRIKTATEDVDITKLIQGAVEPLRRFYIGVAAGIGGKRLHPSLQKALDAFKKATFSEKRERLIELGVAQERAETAAEEDLDTMAEVWLQQTERKAVPSLSDDDVLSEASSKAKSAETSSDLKTE
jgi:DNA-directed RNA polymerase subunit L